ncbi:MAG: transposase [Planctomycetes bacterium]|nr:transposase [Planctomycetota bacterium]
MDRYWLLTWTTYGTWLPGDRRGFVAPVRERDGKLRVHNVPGTPYDAEMPGLETVAVNSLKCAPVRLVQPQADALLEQFHETAVYRGWELIAVAVMAEHVHLVVGVRGDPEPSRILGDFKSYGSRRLNCQWRKPDSGTWWTESGSKRKRRNFRAVLAAVRYVRNQKHPLALWIAPLWERHLSQWLQGEREPSG